MFSKILIANRGEIAIRIMRACKEMGISTVAVFSDADRDSLHVSLADESYCIGGGPAEGSYLNMTAIITAAIESGSQAIHPGYGFLSENAKFAALCRDCNIVFIGPPAEVIEKMGDKDMARRTMVAAGVPVTAGSDIVTTVAKAKKEAARIGYPLLLKARAGGGGRGIRRVECDAELEKAFEMARSEAQACFSDGALYMEKFISPAKHIEAQVLADAAGNVVVLGERECSIQRKNQKLIEESPSLAVDEKLKQHLIDVTRKAAIAVGYVNAGTIEYLLDTSGNLYFMEMNTRLQVEHAVTEIATGIDIVKWQIRIAAGLPMTFEQQDIVCRGATIECRINAENPLLNFRPCCGKVNILHIPGGPWVRFDSALYQNYVIPPYYDSLIGKIIVRGGTREEAIRKMQAALCELVIEGIDHNADFLQDIISEPDFISGNYYTNFLAKREERNNKT